MKSYSVVIGGRTCEIRQRGEKPQYLLVQPVDEHDLEDLESEVREISAQTEAPFLLAAFRISDWDNELTPWPAAPVFGKTPFGDGARKTLQYVTDVLLPGLKEEYFSFIMSDAEWADMQVFLGGYSLAGFFALWSAYQTNLFDGICGASPSVWYPGWMEYAGEHELSTGKIYLSLGDREERTKNAVMASVGDHIRALDMEYSGNPAMDNMLEWNKGGHFKDSGLRTAKGFAWLMGRRETNE